MFLVLTRRALFVFIPTNSDGQISVNLRNKLIEEKIKIKLSLLIFVLSRLMSSHFLLCFFFSGTHMSLFLSFSVRFSPETIYFVPVSISFIIIEYSLNIFHFFGIFQKSRFQVSLYIHRLEIRKIFRLSRNSTKLF